MMEGITEFWNKTSLEALLVMTEEALVSEDQISFDCTNELNYLNNYENAQCLCQIDKILRVF